MEMIRKKNSASGAIGYVTMFTMVLLMVVISLYLAQVAKLMTHQHHIDDSLVDSVLASLVADDEYYYKTSGMSESPVLRFRDVDESHRTYEDCMNNAIADTDEFYYNFDFDVFICYEVEGSSIKITEYSGAAGTKSIHNGEVGSVSTPNGKIVSDTSAYGKVRFDVKNIIDDSLIPKTRDVYCTLEISD